MQAWHTVDSPKGEERPSYHGFPFWLLFCAAYHRSPSVDPPRWIVSVLFLQTPVSWLRQTSIPPRPKKRNREVASFQPFRKTPCSSECACILHACNSGISREAASKTVTTAGIALF